MSNEKKKMALPKLRFPEFQDAGKWEEKKLGEIVQIKSGFSPSNYSLAPSGKYPFLKVEDLNNCEKYQVRSREYSDEAETVIPSKSVIFPKRGAAIQLNKVRINLDEVLMDTNLMALIPNDEIDVEFLHSIIINIGLSKIADTSTIPQINNKHIIPFNVVIPSVFQEQQKIAACLSSLGDLITAQSAKLAALQAQKRGLMQRLFPTAGETIPRLRFREFRNSGEWVEKKLGQLGVLVSGLTYSPNDVRESGLLVLRSSNVQNGKVTLDDCVYVTPIIKGANLSKPNDILICVRNGSKALIGKNALIPEGMPLCTHGAFMSVFRAVYPAFVFQLFQSDLYNRQVSADLGATINSINGSQLLKYIFYVPEIEEQKKIADCLSSLDDRIAAQKQKIVALNLHKKGLMQRLFPSLISEEI